MTAILGVDYSGRPPNPAHLFAAGYRFAARYISAPGNPKNLTAPEARALLAAGVDVVLVWEGGATDALGGFAAGSRDGARAKMMAGACGAPLTAGIYWAVDFDAQPAQMPVVLSYGSGFASACGPHPAGPYGSYAVVTAALTRLAAPIAWQAAAWSGGRRNPAAHLYQRIQQIVIDGTPCDVDEATGPYGGWMGAAAPVPPVPVPLPLPPALTDPEEPTMLVPVQLPKTVGGNGWWDCDGNPGIVGDPAAPPRPVIAWAKFRAVTVNGNDGTPTDDGTVRANDHAGTVRLSFYGFPPGANGPLVWVQVAL